MKTTKDNGLTYEETLSKATAYCAKAEHCISDVRDKMRSWGADEQTTDKIIDYLVAEKYVDNERYATAYVLDKFRFNHWGKNKIKVMLKAKGINDTLINNALDNINPDIYFEVLANLLLSKKRTLTKSDGYTLRNKLTAFAYQRGFEYEIITEALKQILAPSEEI